MDESDADSEDDEDELDEVEESEDADDFVGSQLPAGQLARNPYPELAKDGCWRLSQYLTDNELERHSHLGPFPRESFYKTCQQILLSTHRSLRDGILSGNLQKAIADSPRELNDIIDGLAFRASQGQPGHYLFEYVNPSTGLAPTPQQIEAILGYAERYLASAPADHALVEKIDCWKRARNVLRSFIDDLRQFVRDSKCQATSPMDQALRDVGYARNCSDRIAQHRSHSSSNYLMNLVEAIGGVLNYSYRNVAAVIGLCSEPEQAVVGEILWSCIGQSYLDTGRGYNHESAGKSNRSADDVRTLQWAAWQNWAYEKSPFEKNREEDVRLSEQAQEDQAAWIERTVDLQNQVDHPSHFTESQDAALVASDDEDQDALAAAEQLLMELETDGNTSQRDLTAARQMVRGVAEDRRKVHAALERDIGSLESIHQGRQRRGD